MLRNPLRLASVVLTDVEVVGEEVVEAVVVETEVVDVELSDVEVSDVEVVVVVLAQLASFNLKVTGDMSPEDSEKGFASRTARTQTTVIPPGCCCGACSRGC